MTTSTGSLAPCRPRPFTRSQASCTSSSFALQSINHDKLRVDVDTGGNAAMANPNSADSSSEDVLHLSDPRHPGGHVTDPSQTKMNHEIPEWFDVISLL